MKRYLMILSMTALAVVATAYANEAVEVEDASPILPVSIDVSKRVPVSIDDVRALRTYASSNSYYFGVNLRDGMKVLYSASYGVGGEAGQAAGTIVEKNGRFYFKQRSNPTGQLLLPPGLPHNSGNQSMWDIGAYMDLVNRVAFSEPNAASKTATNIYGKPGAALVDFKGGTAGNSVTYVDALEVNFTKTLGTRASSELKVYYARGIGPVAIEFRENKSPAGTFKFYLGQ